MNLCPHGRIPTAYCEPCSEELHGEQITWVDEIVGNNAYIDGLLQPKPEGAHFRVKGEGPYEEDITAQSILQESIDCISDRAPFRDANGEKSIELAAEVFSNLTGHDLTEYDACIFLACIKLARSQRGEFTRDDYVDAVSYIGLAGEARAREVRPSGRRPEEGKNVREEWIEGWNKLKPNVD